MSTRKYMSLAKTSRATAYRGCGPGRQGVLRPSGKGGRSSAYEIVASLDDPRVTRSFAADTRLGALLAVLLLAVNVVSVASSSASCTRRSR